MTAHYLGIDVSKGYADFVLLDAAKQHVVPPFQLDDNAEGHAQLRRLLDSQLLAHPDSPIHCGVESTGGYENNWYNFIGHLHQSQPRIRIVRLNPRAVAHTGKANLQRVVTDQVSAGNIAEHLLHQADKIRYADTQAAYSSRHHSLQPIYSGIISDTKQVTQHLNQLEKLLYSTFPEYLESFKSLAKAPNWALHFLQTYPTAAALSEARGKLKHFPRQSADTIKTLRQKVCQRSAAIQNDPHLHKAVIDLVTKIIRQKQDIQQNKAYLAKHIDKEQKTLLMSIPGIGEYSACVLLITIGDIKRFATADKLAAFLGVNPEYKQSGDGIIKPGMSKKGSPHARSILYIDAQTAVRGDAHMKSLYTRFIQKGWTYNQALGAVMHKLTRVIWGILQSNKPYNPDIDQSNQQKTKEAKVSDQQAEVLENSNGLRRMQPISTEAPLSKRNVRKRQAVLKAKVTSQAKTPKEETAKKEENDTLKSEVQKDEGSKDTKTKKTKNDNGTIQKKVFAEPQVSQVDTSTRSSAKT